MSDLGGGPRRMDGFARPTAAAPRAPQPQIRVRPAEPMARPQQRMPEPPRPVEAPPAVQQPRPAKKRSSGGGVWRAVVQFVIGLLVIAGVAAAIVALYIRYYQ